MPTTDAMEEEYWTAPAAKQGAAPFEGTDGPHNETYDFTCPFDLLPFIGLNRFVRIFARPPYVASPLCSMSLATSPVHPVW